MNLKLYTFDGKHFVGYEYNGVVYCISYLSKVGWRICLGNPYPK